MFYNTIWFGNPKWGKRDFRVWQVDRLQVGAGLGCKGQWGLDCAKQSGAKLIKSPTENIKCEEVK